jgi:ferredoxin
LNLRAEAESCSDLECQTRLVKDTALEVVEQLLAPAPQ